MVNAVALERSWPIDIPLLHHLCLSGTCTAGLGKHVDRAMTDRITDVARHDLDNLLLSKARAILTTTNILDKTAVLAYVKAADQDGITNAFLHIYIKLARTSMELKSIYWYCPDKSYDTVGLCIVPVRMRIADS